MLHILNKNKRQSNLKTRKEKNVSKTLWSYLMPSTRNNWDIWYCIYFNEWLLVTKRDTWTQRPQTRVSAHTHTVSQWTQAMWKSIYVAVTSYSWQHSRLKLNPPFISSLFMSHFVILSSTIWVPCHPFSLPLCLLYTYKPPCLCRCHIFISHPYLMPINHLIFLIF